jgi:hypothetical protein
MQDVASVERLTLRSGDRIVLNVNRRVSNAEFNELQKHVKDTWGLPEGVKVIILEEGMSLEVLAREEV